MLDHDHVEDAGVSERRMVWAPWSPAQLIAILFGVIYLIVGAASLARTGLNADAFTDNHVRVFGLGHTALLGVVELIFGLLLLMAGAVPGAGRSLMAFLGTLALGFGVVVLAATANMYDAFGVNAAAGWFYVLTGVIVLIAAIAAPIIFRADEHAVEYDHDVEHVGRRRYHFFH